MSRNPSSSENGFTLIEVLVAALLLSAVLVGTLILFEHATRTSADARSQRIALALARQKIEEIRDMEYNAVVTQVRQDYPGFEDFEYEITVGSCTPPDPKEVTVTVYYSVGGVSQEVSLTTEKGSK
ncbi:MAG: type II secretion system protein [Bacillota bacterium]|nr:type II secretion system protein [Bacillota bacterium]